MTKKQEMKGKLYINMLKLGKLMNSCLKLLKMILSFKHSKPPGKSSITMDMLKCEAQNLATVHRRQIFGRIVDRS